MRVRSVSWMFGIIAIAAAWAALGPGSETAAQVAGCGGVPSDAVDLFTLTPPLGGDGIVRGPAPLTVTVTVRGGLVTIPSGVVTATISWGDGGAAATIASQPCGDGETEVWAQQDLAHTFATPGTYSVGFSFSIPGFSFAVPWAAVEVTSAATPAPTATATTTTPEPTATTPAPTATTPAPTATTPAPAATSAAPTADTTTPVPAPAVVESPSATPVPTATPTSTPVAPAAGANPTAGAAAPVAVVTPEAEQTQAASADASRPEVIRALRDIDEVSANPEVVGTNVALAGATVWVLFTSVLLNQVLQENRSEVERRTQWLTAPVRGVRSQASRLRRSRGLGPRRFGWLGPAAVVLLLTGLIYSSLDPGFGANETTVVLFFATVLGVGLLTYACSGLEALATSRMTGATATVRPYPATIAIAVVAVVVSRALDFQPGMVYGFVASCVVLTPMTAGVREKGRIALVVVLVGLVLTVGAWLSLAPIRAAEGNSGGWGLGLAESVAVMVFVGGIEGVFFSMIPVAATDGGKIYRWNRVLWGLIAVTAAFLFWHVLLGRQQTYFSGVRETQSLSVIVLFLVYTSLTIAAWMYFRFRHDPALPE